jgi:drug/metabolite transporter (DMT)-like permease
MPKAVSNNIRGIVFTTLAFAVFSYNDIAGKSLMDNFAPFNVSFWISLFAVLTMLIFSKRLGGLSSCFQTPNLKWHFMRTALTAFAPFLVLYAVTDMPLVNFYTIVFLAPFITAIFSELLFKESVPRFRWLIIGAGFLSVLIGVRPDLHGFGLPELAVVAVAVSFALRNLIIIKMGPQESLLSYGFLPYCGVCIVSFVGALTEGLVWPDPVNLLLMISIGVTAAGGFVALSYGFRIADASAVAPTHYSQMIWGAVFGYLIFGDIPDFWGGIGATLVCVFGVWLIWTEHKIAYDLRVRNLAQ